MTKLTYARSLPSLPAGTSSATAAGAAQPYQRCMVMGGGGFRFGIYLGMYAAMRDAGRAPDMLLASCGGAIAAAIIGALPDDASRKEWINSAEMYRFWCGLKATRRARLVHTLVRAARRKWSHHRAAVIPDLFGDYLFEIPPQLPLPPQSGAATAEVDVAIIGGKLLFGEHEVGQPRGTRKLYTETVFCGPRAATLLHGMASPLADPRWGEHPVSHELATDSSLSLAEAARISIGDMFYFRCQPHAGENYLGGVVDLFPVEVAQRLAGKVALEYKEAFDQVFSIPAWRAVLGLDGNARLRYANGRTVETRIDSSDVSLVLARHQLQTVKDWRRNRIELAMPPRHEIYVQHMQAQWEYGYQRATEACRREAGAALPVRRETRHSRAMMAQ